MRNELAVISDIHGNVWALEAVLKDIQKRNILSVVNLGDSLYGPLEPYNTAKILMTEKILNISGNQDRMIAEAAGNTNLHQTMKYVLEKLDAGIIEWIRSLSGACVFQNFFLCHGTPEADDKYLLESVAQDYHVDLRSDMELLKECENISQQIILCGHSHIPGTVYLSSGKLIINPGSVGLQAYEDDLPYKHVMESGSPHARYAIIIQNGNGIEVENILLPYPFEKAARCASERKRPDWEKALLYGRM